MWIRGGQITVFEFGIVKVAVCYVYVNNANPKFDSFAQRFARKYIEHPPGETDHELYMLVNGGGQITRRQEQLSAPLAFSQYLYHNNNGKDIGAYQMAARTIDCDLLVCCGSPTRPCLAGWLDLMVGAVVNNGPGLYGLWGFHAPAVHLRTTLFWLPPQVLSAYPIQVTNERRYEFEFGPNSISAFCMKLGLPAFQVTASGVYPPQDWHHVERDDSLFLDQHCDRMNYKD